MLSLNIIINLIFSGIDSIIFINLLSAFRSNKDYYKSIDIIVVTSITIVMFIFTEFGIAPYIKITFISIIIFLVTFLYTVEFYERVLLVILFYFIVIISELLVVLIVSNILNMNIESMAFSYKYSFLFLGVMSKFLTIIISSIAKRRFKEKKVILPKFLSYVLISVLLLSILSMVLLFYVTLNLYFQKIQFTLLLICLFMLLISTGILIIYFSANDFYISLQKQTTKSIYNKSYEKFIINSKKREDLLSKMWHDMNNHIKVLEEMTYLKSSNNQYLETLKNNLKSIPNKINSGNNLIDTILNDKYLEATSHNINFDIKTVVPPNLDINDLDLSAILFNTIDNSIEACLNDDSKNKTISLELYPDGNFLFYKIKNSYRNNINSDFSKKVYSNKKKYISKGYGLRIIKDIVEKYDGYINISKNKTEYLVIIILHLPIIKFNK